MFCDNTRNNHVQFVVVKAQLIIHALCNHVSLSSESEIFELVSMYPLREHVSLSNQ